MDDRAIYSYAYTRRCLGDEQLMRRVGNDDPLAFAMLYERHVGSALRLAVQICSRYALAEEVVQEAFLSLWRNRLHYDCRRGSVRAWLLWIVRNRAIDVLRQSVSHEPLPGADELVDAALHAKQSTDGQASRREDARRVFAALEDLPPDQSAVIALAYYGGYTHSEIASILGTPIGTVKGRMRLGLHKMAQRLIPA